MAVVVSKRMQINDMAIKILSYNFDGPYSTTGAIQEKAGVYVILCQKNGRNHVIDVCESSSLKGVLTTMI